MLLLSVHPLNKQEATKSIKISYASNTTKYYIFKPNHPHNTIFINIFISYLYVFIYKIRPYDLKITITTIQTLQQNIYHSLTIKKHKKHKKHYPINSPFICQSKSLKNIKKQSYYNQFYLVKSVYLLNSMMLLSELPISLPEDHINHDINLQAITLWTDDDFFLIQPNYKKSLIKTSLQINRKTGAIEQIQTDSSKSIKETKPYHMSLLMGILDICGNKVLAFAEEVTLVMTIKKRDVFQIKKPRLIYFERNHKPKQQQYEQIKMFETIFEAGLYFSYAYELTQLLQSSEVDPKREQYFNWCYNIQKPFQHVDKRWKTSVIQGYVGKFQIFVRGKKLHFSLISRRSTKMAGVRYLARGINSQGDTANFVQTQQIMIYENYIFSYLMLRGSVPLFWTHKQQYRGLLKDIVINKNFQKNRSICIKHFEDLSKQHGEVTVVNLLSQARSSEAKLIQCFQAVIKSTTPQVRYVYYDLHEVSPLEKTKGSNFFVENNLKRTLQNQKFFCLYFDQENNTKEIKEKQKGVFRVNCLDCIQRSGIMQTKISALQISYALKHIGINLFENLEASELDYFDDTSHPFSYLLKNIWGSNADYLSQQYTGTKSANSFFYKPSYQLLDKLLQHALVSISRTFIDLGKYDEQKQKVIKALLGQAAEPEATSTSCMVD